MKKILVLFILLLSLTGCSSSNDYHPSIETPNITGVSTDRLIIYTVNYSLYVDNLEEILDQIDLISVDKWYDEKSVYNKSAYLYLRVKTSELDSFVNSTKELGSISNYNIKSTDITNSYYDLESDKERLLTEKARLLELLSTASITDIIVINTRLNEIDKELNDINKQLQEFDTSLLYSYVNISVYQEELKSGFWSSIGSSFTSGISFVGKLFQFGITAIVFLTPIALVASIPTTIIIVVSKKKKKKNIEKDNE